MDETLLQNVQNEILVVGSIFKNTDLYIEHGRFIKSKYDFSDEVTRFYYDNFELMYKTFTQTIDENKLNTYMSQDKERLKNYRKYGGFKIIKTWMDLSNPDDFKNYIEIIKKYSLLREYDKRGYAVQKIMSHPKFNIMKANDIYKIIRSGADKISTEILSDEETIAMNNSNADFVKKWLLKPQMGLEIPFKLLNEMFRGLRLGKMFALGFLSNEGKTRLAILLASFIAFCKGEKVYLIANETDEDDIRACLLTTVINNEFFKQIHGVDIGKVEREIVLGIYKDDTGKVIERKINDDGEYIENEDDFSARVYNESSAYRKVLQVAEWIDSQEGNTIFFERLKDYSDNNLEFKIRKTALSKGVKYFIYDTLKGYKDENWAILKQTTTMLSDLMGELKCCLWVDIQLTDDSVYTDIFSFSSNNIANAKQLKHVLDHLILGKRLIKEEYHKYKVIPNENMCWGEIMEMDLDLNKTYYAIKVDKNRSGSKDKIPVLEVDLDKNIWLEIGHLIKASK
jgi:replicative DNA helicase